MIAPDREHEVVREGEVDLYKTGQAAKRLNLSEPMIFRLMAEGELERIKIGRATRIPRQSIEAYIARLRANGAP